MSDTPQLTRKMLKTHERIDTPEGYGVLEYATYLSQFAEGEIEDMATWAEDGVDYVITRLVPESDEALAKRQEKADRNFLQKRDANERKVIKATAQENYEREMLAKLKEKYENTTTTKEMLCG